MKTEGFVLVSKDGQWAVSRFGGGGFATGKAHDTVGDALSIDNATVFTPASRRGKPYKAAMKAGYTEVPAYSIKNVYLGVLT